MSTIKCLASIITLKMLKKQQFYCFVRYTLKTPPSVNELFINFPAETMTYNALPEAISHTGLNHGLLCIDLCHSKDKNMYT